MSWREEREALLNARISELGLQIEGSALQPLIEQLYEELDAAGLTFKPPVYLSDEWGCPEGMPVIAVPFYLATPQLSQIEQEIEDSVETAAESLMYLRHEAGHAYNYAYRLYELEEWHRVFGPYSRPYVEDYRPEPFSPEFVRHIPGWYAQKHPDEDFAETFAVWLTPNSRWSDQYAGTGAERKLRYVDELMQSIVNRPPKVRPDRRDLPVEQMTFTVGDYYERRGSERIELPRWFDGDLQEMFGREGRSAAAVLLEKRKTIVEVVAYWTGARQPLIRELVNHLVNRVETLELCSSDEQRDILSFTAMVTTLALNSLRHASFIPRL